MNNRGERDPEGGQQERQSLVKTKSMSPDSKKRTRSFKKFGGSSSSSKSSSSSSSGSKSKKSNKKKKDDKKKKKKIKEQSPNRGSAKTEHGK